MTIKKYVAFTSLTTAILFFVLGVIFWGGFNWSMEMTNTESFCISCHEMKDNPYQEYKESVHYSNRTGVQASCPDCHVPKEWIHKVIRKIQASSEIYHTLVGSIDTREKFLAKRPYLIDRVWDSMRNTDSRECRNCHSNTSMHLEKQNKKAAVFHKVAFKMNKTCIDCHQGIAHKLPENIEIDKVMNEVHAVIETEKFECVVCHEDMPTPPKDENWDWD